MPNNNPIQSSSTLESSAVLERIHRMPSLPVVVMELLASMDQEDVPVGVLAHQIAQDQTLTAKALRLSNSSFYGRSQSVNSINEAISVLGFRAIRSIVTSAGIMQAMYSPTVDAKDLLPFWRHALGAAVCARELAPHLQVSPDWAYTAGLLHDIGRLILISQFPTHYAAVLAYRQDQDCSTFDAENAVLGLNHASVGAELSHYWKFSSSMQSAIGSHHGNHPPSDDPLCAAVYWANVLAHGLELAPTDPAAALPLTTPSAWPLLPAEPGTMDGILENARKSYARAIDILND